MQNSIRIRLAVAFIGLAIVPLLVVGAVLAWQSFSVQRDQALEMQREVVQRASTQVEAFIFGLETELRVIAQSWDLKNMDGDSEHRVLSKLVSYDHAFKELALLDSEGRERARVSRLAVLAAADFGERSEADEFVVPMVSGETYYSPVSFDQLTGEPSMTMAVPIVDPSIGLVGNVLVADIRLNEIWDVIARMRVGQDGIAYIVDHQKRIVAHRDPSVVLRGTNFAVPDSDGIHTGLLGSRVVLASEEIRLGDQKLTVVTERPVSEAMALTFRTVFITAALILAALVAALVLGFFVVRNIVRPISMLAATARAIADGDIWKRADDTRQDELGVLGSAFNRMTAQLRDIIESLERRVAERTGELSESNIELEAEIDERRRVEDALRESNQALKALIQASPLAVIAHDSDAQVQMWNPAAERIFGWSELEVLGHTYPLVPEDKQDEFRANLERSLRGEALAGVETRRQRKDGTPIDVGIWTGPLHDGGAMVVIADITERKQAQETLFQQMRDLAVLEERNRLAREIHDSLAQGLTGIIWQLNAAKQLVESGGEQALQSLDRVSNLAREGLQEARRSVWDLRAGPSGGPHPGGSPGARNDENH